MAEIEPGTILSPDEATQQDQVRQFLTITAAVAGVGGVLQITVAILIGKAAWGWVAVLHRLLAAWNIVVSRRRLREDTVESSISLVMAGSFVVLAGMALLEPHLAIVLATGAVIPVAIALPFLATRATRRLLVVASATILVAAAASFRPTGGGASTADLDLIVVVSLVMVLSLIVVVLYLSSERLKASSREFSRLFALSSDLAETSDPGVLGEIVARHLAAAIGFDDCVLYALEPETGRLVPFGSSPVERALETGPASLADRPMLQRVIHDRTHALLDVAEALGEPDERARLQRLGRAVMLVLPLVAPTGPVGVAELTATGSHPVDERHLALLLTLAFEAAMAIENGRLYQQVQQRSLHDGLTGLANASLFHDRTEHALERLARREGAMVAVLFGDLDGFKGVNDRLGHAAGDRLLAIVAERLRTVVRAGDTVARLGRDEFGLLLEEAASAREALLVAERAIAAVAVPLELAGQPVSASLSIGVAVRSSGGATGTTVDALIGEAGTAMYAAKAAGKGRAAMAQSV